MQTQEKVIDYQIVPLSEEGKGRAIPQSSLGAVKAFQESMDLSTDAKLHLKGFAAFYKWADPLFSLNHIKLGNHQIHFSLLVSKRYLISTSAEETPRLEVQPPEFAWMRLIPWAYSAIDLRNNRIILVARPAQPLKMCYFIIQVDIAEKLKVFEGKRYLEIKEALAISKNKSLMLEIVDMRNHPIEKNKHRFV